MEGNPSEMQEPYPVLLWVVSLPKGGQGRVSYKAQ